MADVVNKQVSIYITSGDAEATLDRLKKKELELKDALKQATDPRVIANLNSELKKLEQPIDVATKKMKGQLSPSIKDLSKTVTTLKRDLIKLSEEDPGFKAKVAQFKQAKIELENARNAALQFNEAAKGVGGKIASGITNFASGFGIGAGLVTIEAAGELIKGVLTSSIEEAENAKRSINNFSQALDAAGRSDAFDRLSASAEKFADTYKFLGSGDFIDSFAALVSYGKLTERQINDLIPVIVDFYSKQQLAGNTSITLADATKAVTDAIDGNAKALKQYGINIKDGKTETERLNIVMDELAKKVSGSSELFGEGFQGQIQQTNEEIKSLKEELGNKLLPVWEKVKLGFYQGIKGLIEGFSSLREKVSDVFLTAQQRWNKLNDEIEANRVKQINDFANSFASDAAKKSVDEQKKILAEQEALLKSSEKALKERRQFDMFFNGNFSEEQRQLIAQVEQDQAVVDKLKELLSVGSDNRTFGSKLDAGGSDTADKIKKLREELEELERVFKLKSFSDFQRTLAEINNRFDKLVERAKELGSSSLVDRANQQREKELEGALIDFEDQLAKRIAKGVDIPVRVNPIITPDSASKFAKGVEKLLQGRTPGSLNIGTGSKKEKDDDKVAQALEFASGVTSIYSSLTSELNSLLQTQIDQEVAANEKKKESYQKLLDANLISKKEYDRKVAAADLELARKQKDLRRQQFNRDRIESGLRAAMNIAEGITKALTAGPILGQILGGITATFGAVQLGLIASKKFPEYGKGGKLNGPSHKQGGMPVINPRTGRKEAEVEGGEVILSANTVRNNADLVNELLYSSLNRNGATIGSVYRSHKSLPSVNYGSLQQSLQRVTHYERGGSFTTASASTDESMNTLRELSATVKALQIQLAGGITAVASVQQLNTEQDRLAALKEDITMR